MGLLSLNMPEKASLTSSTDLFFKGHTQRYLLKTSPTVSIHLNPVFLEINEICLAMAIHFTAKDWCSDPGVLFSKPQLEALLISSSTETHKVLLYDHAVHVCHTQSLS